MERQIKLVRPEYLNLLNDDTGEVRYFGSDQEWFPDAWQRMAGCAPSVASNIILYNYQKSQIEPKAVYRQDFLSLMEEVWEYVTPGAGGLASTLKFARRVKDFALQHDIRLKSNILKVSLLKSQRPSLDDVIDFISKSLEEDTPVAFLNLCNGEVSKLDRWHWVTIIGITFDKEAGSASLLISDAAKALEIDLALWLTSSSMGGGFVYFTEEENDGLTQVTGIRSKKIRS